MTPHEVKLWNWLREAVGPTGYHFRRQVPIDRFVVDFACLKARVIIEVDGEQHGREDTLRERDRMRDASLAELGFRVVRFTNRDVDREKSMVLDTILTALEGRLDATATNASVGARVSVDSVSPRRHSPPRFGFADSALPCGEGSPRSVYGAD